MNLLPVFLKLDGRRCLVVGAGSVALEKIGSLLKTGLRIHVVAPDAIPEIRQLAIEGKLDWIQRPFELADLDGNFLVIAATDSAEINAAVYQGAVERGILANSVDDPPNCDFYFGSVVSRGALQIAISTAGESPAFAQRLRREIDEQLPGDLGPWLERLGRLRREVLATHPRDESRKVLLHQLAGRQLCDKASCPSRRLALTPLQKATDSAGKVYLVGAGPGDPELLTVRALRLIQAADLILHDDLVPQAILRLAPPAAEIINVGKRCGVKSITQEQINVLMVESARAHHNVIRLKSGDPLIFSRAAEEIVALTEANILFEIVPGISAAFAAAAAIGCPLTSRNSASSVIFSAGHHAQSQSWRVPLPRRDEATRVVYMPGRDLNLLAQQWLDEGLPPDFPCAVVSQASRPGQQLRDTTLAALGNAEPVNAPSLLIAGWALRESSAAFQTEEIDDSVPV
ncbi:MAG: siroheme synthase CysG [Terracidiphilus sp.]